MIEGKVRPVMHPTLGWPGLDYGNFVRYVIPADHRYVALLCTDEYSYVSQSPRGVWRVRWRDFTTVKQETEHATEAEARRALSMLRIGPHFADDLADDPEYYNAEFWQSSD